MIGRASPGSLRRGSISHSSRRHTLLYVPKCSAQTCVGFRASEAHGQAYFLTWVGLPARCTMNRHQGSYLRHIQNHTNTRVSLRGIGSNYSHSDPAEANDKLHLLIVYGPRPT